VTAPRWQDVPEALPYVVRIVREEREGIAADLPHETDINARETFEAWVAQLDHALVMLARLAEPESAAEQWRAADPSAKRFLTERLTRDRAGMQRDHERWPTDGHEHDVAALDAMLALAREAERSGG